MNTKLITSTFDTKTADMFIQNISSEPYYLFVGKHTPYTPDDQTLEEFSNAIQITTSNAYNNMQFGRKVKSTDVLPVIPRHDWQSGTVFAQYENTDEDLFGRNFYTVVTNGGNLDVYKCLFNNNGANSTVQPTGQDLQPFSSPVDGYIWKYMYTFSTTIESKFATSNSIPVIANTTVQAAAVPGTIEVIEVLSEGLGYANHFASTFRAQDLMVGGFDVKFGLTEDASDLNSFYENCIMKITSGVGVNQYRRIIDYTITGGQKVVTLESNFDIPPAATDSYQIYPGVYTTGDGHETANCVAWAIVNAVAGNTITTVEVLDPGQNFRTGTSVIVSDPTVAVDTEATLSPIISPPDGHGFNPELELGAKQVCISVTFAGTEGNTIPIDNDYRTIGLIKNPLFANVHAAINFSTQIGVFSQDETVHTFRRTRLVGSVNVTSGSPTVVGSNTDFSEALSLGDRILITDGVNNFFSPVAAVTNATSVTLSANATWSNTSCSIAVVDYLANATLTSANSSVLVLDNVDATFNDNYLHIIGGTSSATVDMDSLATPIISINGNAVGDFDIFVQMTKLTGTLSSGSFTPDETVTQATTLNPTAKFFDYISGTPSYIYLTNITQDLSVTDNIVGESSGAVFIPTNKYDGELKVDSGQIMYIENISPISRASNKTETVKIILEF